MSAIIDAATYAVQSAIEAALSGLSQHVRLLRLGLPGMALDLGALLGQPVLIELPTPAGTSALRPFHAHITAAALLGSDGGLARYRLSLAPWLAFLDHRQDSRRQAHCT